MIPKLTDQAISLLPLESGRAELLEEIMSTTVTDRQTAEPTEPPTRRRGWLIPAAAAAVVAGIAVSSLWWHPFGAGGKDGSQSAASSLNHSPGEGIALDAPGWKIDSLNSDGLRFRKGDAELEVTSYGADSYDSYVVDREHIVQPPAPGQPIEVLGKPAQMWAYSAQDHTAIRVVEDGHWMEFRGDGMDQAAYLALLGQLRLTSETEFNASLPDAYVPAGDTLPDALERSAAAEKIVGDIQAVSGAGFPQGTDEPKFENGDAKDPYQFGVEVAGAYTCAWLEFYENADAHDQPARAAEALQVLGTSRDWPILEEMDKSGDYPDVLWQIADEAKTGELQPWYREGLGC